MRTYNIIVILEGKEFFIVMRRSKQECVEENKAKIGQYFCSLTIVEERIATIERREKEKYHALCLQLLIHDDTNNIFYAAQELHNRCFSDSESDFFDGWPYYQIDEMGESERTFCSV